MIAIWSGLLILVIASNTGDWQSWYYLWQFFWSGIATSRPQLDFNKLNDCDHWNLSLSILQSLIKPLRILSSLNMLSVYWWLAIIRSPIAIFWDCDRIAIGSRKKILIAIAQKWSAIILQSLKSLLQLLWLLKIFSHWQSTSFELFSSKIKAQFQGYANKN